jgi:SAM-dependent methyltransferase
MGRKAIFADLILRFSKHLPSKAECVALDLGCGMGAMMPTLKEVASEVLGTDISQESLAHCQARGFPNTFRAKGHEIPIADNSLDLIVALDTLEHIPQERETLTECFRMLRPGGILMISVPAYQFLFTHQDKVVHHQRRYTRGDLKRKVLSVGLLPIKASHINFFLFPIILPIVLLIKLKEFLNPPGEHDSRSNVGIRVPRWVNTVLYKIFASERWILRWVSIPVGHSLIVCGRKPSGDGDAA